MTPRLLTRERAAEYCGLTPEGFSAWVKSGRMPAALEKTRRWDRVAIDQALDRLSGLTGTTAVAKPVTSALDAWKAKKG